MSGQKKVSMPELKLCLVQAGLLNVETYIQSGNVFFDVDERDERDLTEIIERAIKSTFEFDVPTLVLPREIFRQVINRNPFLNDEVDTKKLYVAFLFDPLDKNLVDALAEAYHGHDNYEIKGGVIYMKFQQGIGKSKMDNNFFERKLKLRATTRNWNTVLKLSGKS